MTHLTAVILTYNEADNIADCVASVRFADRVVVFDSGSADATQQLAREAGADVIEHAFVDYSGQRNAALNAVADGTDWVLFVDADERVTDQLAVEIRSVITAPDDVAGWQIPRHNYIFGHLTQAAGWYPDYQTRLLRVGYAQYDPARRVHEVVVLDGDLGTLGGVLVHYNYRDVTQFGVKQRRYSRYDASILYQQGVKPKPYSLLSMPLRQFWWRFVTLSGYRDGLHGLHLSLLMARYEFYKYRLLWGMWRGAVAPPG